MPRMTASSLLHWPGSQAMLFVCWLCLCDYLLSVVQAKQSPIEMPRSTHGLAAQLRVSSTVVYWFFACFVVVTFAICCIGKAELHCDAQKYTELGCKITGLVQLYIVSTAVYCFCACFVVLTFSCLMYRQSRAVLRWPRSIQSSAAQSRASSKAVRCLHVCFAEMTFHCLMYRQSRAPLRCPEAYRAQLDHQGSPLQH